MPKAQQEIKPMTQQQRMDILSKEVLTIKDIERLFGIGYMKASEVIRVIKATSDRLDISGVVHIQDYIEHFKLPVDRYVVTVVAERDKNDKIQLYRKAE